VLPLLMSATASAGTSATERVMTMRSSGLTRIVR
jgi:hypothetical protein